MQKGSPRRVRILQRWRRTTRRSCSQLCRQRLSIAFCAKLRRAQAVCSQPKGYGKGRHRDGRRRGRGGGVRLPAEFAVEMAPGLAAELSAQRLCAGQWSSQQVRRRVLSCRSKSLRMRLASWILPQRNSAVDRKRSFGKNLVHQK